MLRKLILKGLYFSGVQSLLGPFTRGTGSILMLHHVSPAKKRRCYTNSHLYITPHFLDRLILSYKRQGYDFISLDELADRLENPQQGKSRKPFICITLDDGYRDNFEHAVPVFRRHEVPYAIYIAPGLVDGTATLWWEDIEQVIEKRDHIYVELPTGRAGFDIATREQKNATFEQLADDLLFVHREEDQRKVAEQLARDYGYDAKAHLREQIMDWTQINELVRDPLCTIGAHTIDHYALAKLDEKQVRYEMSQSRAVILAETGLEATHFAYPYGHDRLAGSREFAIAKELGYRTAVTTRHGVVTSKHADHMTALPRVSINGNFQSIAETRSLTSGLPAMLMNKGSALNVRDVPLA